MSQTFIRRTFLSELMGEKPVTAIPGIGTSISKKLKQQNFKKAKDVYKKLFELNFNKKRFQSWIRSVSGRNNDKHSATAHENLVEYRQKFHNDPAAPPGDYQEHNIRPEVESRSSLESPIPPRNYEQNEELSDPLKAFFLSTYALTRTFPPRLQLVVKNHINTVMFNAENSMLPLDNNTTQQQPN